MSEFTYNKKQFLLDGKPFTIISGAIHYFRVVPEYWEDRLKKLRACGFNTVETYVAWNLHERKEGKFDFSGRLDIVRFIEIANSLGLNVIFRPGPYICAEFEGGGLPSWLLTYPKIKIRCNDPNYLKKVRPYYRELFTRVSPYLCTKGGPIIMVQIENEYGSYGNDHAYMRAIANIYKEYGRDCLLFTADGSCDYMIEGGTLPEYPAVMNFGSNPKEAFDALDRLHPGQPICVGSFGVVGLTIGGKSTTFVRPKRRFPICEKCLKWARRLTFICFTAVRILGSLTEQTTVKDLVAVDMRQPLLVTIIAPHFQSRGI